MRKFLAAILLMMIHMTQAQAQIQGQVFQVPTRTGVSTTLFWQAVDGAKATVFIFPGGGGGFGKLVDGKPGSNNFLVRAMPYFLANGFNVAIFGRPSDSEDLDFADRISDTHLSDIRAVLDQVKKQSAAPIWIVGTSRGTISTTAMAIKIQDPAIAGLVLTSSIVNYKKPGAVPKQDLAAITIPTLILHHNKDACMHCQPHEVPAILRGLKNAPAKKMILADGGSNPTGDACAALHWHGFIGMEKEAVDMISEWIRNPSP